MSSIPNYIGLLFGLTTCLTIGIFYRATKNSKITLVVLLSWLVLQTPTALSGFYTVTGNMPPRIIFLLLPPLLLIIWLFLSTSGKKFIDDLDIKTLTILHIIRIPIELILYGLYIYKTIPELMTFEGRNFDIISGLTAPFIYYFGFIKKQLSKTTLIFWNYICLALLINIVVNAILSAPFPFQKFAFDQPNIAILYFPYIWLPCCVVPIVLFSHLAAIRQLLYGGKIKIIK